MSQDGTPPVTVSSSEPVDGIVLSSLDTRLWPTRLDEIMNIVRLEGETELRDPSVNDMLDL